LSNLTSSQLEALTSGQPVRQSWKIKVPVLADHSAYTETVIDDGILPAVSSPTKRIIRAGTRKHAVWNPHPKMNVTPKAVRYSIEVDNHDGFFHRRSFSAWNPLGIYAAAVGECFLIHQIYVWVPANSAWEEITHMKFIGQVIDVDYSGSAQMSRTEISPGTTRATPAPNTATITTEQVGADFALRRVFTADDADNTKVTDATTGDFYIDFVA